MTFMSSPHDLDAILYECHSMSASQERWEFIERRKRTRIPVHWTVYLTRETDSHPLETVTVNLSSEGFYCRVPAPIIPGEHMDCMLLIPNHCRDYVLCLQGKAEVMRLETKGPDFYIGCRIHNYNIVTLSPHQIPKAQSLAQASVV